MYFELFYNGTNCQSDTIFAKARYNTSSQIS